MLLLLHFPQTSPTQTCFPLSTSMPSSYVCPSFTRDCRHRGSNWHSVHSDSAHTHDLEWDFGARSDWPMPVQSEAVEYAGSIWDSHDPCVGEEFQHGGHSEGDIRSGCGAKGWPSSDGWYWRTPESDAVRPRAGDDDVFGYDDVVRDDPYVSDTYGGSTPYTSDDPFRTVPFFPKSSFTYKCKDFSALLA